MTIEHSSTDNKMLHHYYNLEDGHHTTYFGAIRCHHRTFGQIRYTRMTVFIQYEFRKKYYTIMRLYQNQMQIDKKILKPTDDYVPFTYFDIKKKHVAFKELAIEFWVYTPHEWHLWKSCWNSMDIYIYWIPGEVLKDIIEIYVKL